MIELAPDQLPALSAWFTAGAPGTAALAEHVRATGTGRWWADRAADPRTVAVSCAGHALLCGDPDALAPGALAVLDGHYVRAAGRFRPALGSAFGRIVPWERMLWIHRVPAPAPCPPHGVTVRRLGPGDAPALTALTADAAWIHATWGGPAALAASRLGWAALDRDRMLAVACTYLQGTAYEDLACFTAPHHRRRGLALACVTALCRDVAARGRTPSWTCSRDHRPSRLLAWNAGFRLRHEYVHHFTGQPITRPPVRREAPPVGA